MPRYTVYTVFRDGNPFDVLTTSDPREALDKLDEQYNKHGIRYAAHGIYDPDDPERGDVEDQAEEAAEEMEETNGVE